mgnify:CR=1 FL=1
MWAALYLYYIFILEAGVYTYATRAEGCCEQTALDYGLAIALQRHLDARPRTNLLAHNFATLRELHIAIIECEVEHNLRLLTIHKDIIVEKLKLSLSVNSRSGDKGACGHEVVGSLLLDIITRRHILHIAHHGGYIFEHGATRSEVVIDIRGHTPKAALGALKRDIDSLVKQIDSSYNTVVTVDRA